ncbi:MAG: hypothetical protein U5L09_13935 [Bacteroidales bacterium]|nr:hypothetical protein [Bacteroidales bacterium]
MFAKNTNNSEAAITWLQNAIDSGNNSNSGELKATLATTILESITNPSLLITQQIDFETRNVNLNYASRTCSTKSNQKKSEQRLRFPNHGY